MIVHHLNKPKLVIVDDKICRSCEKPFKPHRRESMASYNRRHYCSRKCGWRMNRKRRGSTKPSDEGREHELYGGAITDAYKVGFVRTVEQLRG